MDIDTLEKQLRKAEKGIDALIRAGQIPTPGDYADIDRINKELKVARRINTMKARREKELLDITISVNISRRVREQLLAIAAARAMTLSDFIRWIIDKHIAAQPVEFSGGLTPIKKGGKVEERP